MEIDLKFVIIISSCAMISTISYPTSSEKLYDYDDDEFRPRLRKDTDLAMTLKRRAALERDPKPYAEVEEYDYERGKDHGRNNANFRITSYEDRRTENRRRHDGRRYNERYGRKSPEILDSERRNEEAEEEVRFQKRREDPVKSSDGDFGRTQYTDNSQSRGKVIHSFSDKEQEKKNYQKMDCDRTHERFESCFAGCAAVTCDNPRERLRPCYPFCEPGCVCLEPWVRDDRTHKCVLLLECTRGLRGIPDLRP